MGFLRVLICTVIFGRFVLPLWCGPGVRLRVKALRGPLEEAMKCFTELQQVQEELRRAEASNGRLTAVVEEQKAELSFSMAERNLVMAQLKHIAIILGTGSAVQAGPPSSHGNPGTPKHQHEQVLLEVAEAEKRLASSWHALPASSSYRFAAGLSELAADVKVVTDQAQSVMKQQQQQLHHLVGHLQELHSYKQRCEQLELLLVSTSQAADNKVRKVAAAVQAKAVKKLLKQEQKASQAVSSLQSHQQQLLTALQAAEEPLLEAQQALEDHDNRRKQLEATLQRKTVALLEAKRDAKEQRRQAEQAALEVIAAQQELSSCKARLSDTARQLSAVRTTAKEAARELAQEQQRSQQAALALEELKAELDKARRSAAASQKAAAADAARAGQSEATAEALRQQLAMAAAASAKLQEQLAAAQAAARQHCRDHEQVVAGHQAELAAADQRLKSAQEIADQATARAESLTGELEGIKQEVAEWAKLRCEHQQVLQVNGHNRSAPSA
eukprot:gene8675-8856_t